ncbi:HD domain-containing protein, partial [Candidatus Bipolaricaulota bacterium]|nr:HD domain-containing protein [Candidatus Bipolaricaulota bacterium]
MNLPAKARIYIYIVGLLAVVAIAYYAPEFSFTSFKQVVVFVLFIFLGFLSEAYATWIPVYGGEISSSLTIYLAALFILGPSLTVFAVLITILGSEILLRWNYIKDAPMRFVHTVTFNVAQWVVTVAVTGVILIVWRHAPLSLRSFNDYIWALGAFLCYSGINLSLVTGIASLTENKRFFYAFKTCMRDFGLQYLVFCVLALLLVVLYSLSIWHMFLAIIPLVLVHVSFRSYLRLQTETRKTFEKISRILDERDHYTAVHSIEVAELAVKIGQEMGLPQREIEKIDIAARVHDVGKIAVPDAILLKPAP